MKLKFGREPHQAETALLLPGQTNNISRRRFIRNVAFGLGGPLVFPFSLEERVVAQRLPDSAASQTISSEFLASPAFASNTFPGNVGGSSYQVWRNFSAPRNIRGMVARGNYVWVAGYTMVGRIDIRDNTFTTYSTQLVPAYKEVIDTFNGTGLFARPLDVDATGYNLWVGTTEHGAYRFDSASWKEFIPKVGNDYLTHVSTIRVDSDTGDIWFGGPNGLIKLHSSFDLQLFNQNKNYQGQEDKVLIELTNTDLHIVGQAIDSLVDDSKNSGYVWLAVEGQDFRRFKANSKNPPVEYLDVNHPSFNALRIPGGYTTSLTAHNGKIWGGTVFGAISINNPTEANPDEVTFSFDNVFQPGVLPVPPILANDPRYIEGAVTNLIVDNDKNLWYLNGGNRGHETNDKGKGLARGVGADRTIFGPGSLPNYPPNQPDFTCSAGDSQGALWFGSSEGVSKFISTSAGFEPLIEIFNSGQRSDLVHDLAIGKDENRGGNVRERQKWFATKNGLYSFNGLAWAVRSAKTEVFAVAVDSKNNRWYAQDDGVYRLEHGTTTPVGPLGAAKARVLKIIEDASGNLTVWAGGENGIFRSSGNGFSQIGSVSGQITAIAASPSQSSVWFGSDDGSIYYFENNNLNIFNTANSNPVRDMAFAPDGSVWAATAYGLARLQVLNTITGTAAIATNLTQLLLGKSTTAIAFDYKKNRAWVAIQNEGLGLISDLATPTIYRLFTTQDGLVYQAITRIAIEPNPYTNNQAEEDILWISTEHGISQFAVATPGTSYEPNDDRFFGFPLIEPPLDQFYEKIIETKLDRPYDIDWFRVNIRQRYSRISIKLIVPEGADYDLVLYPPGRKSKSNSGIFGGLDDIGFYMDIPTSDTGFYMDIPAEDLGFYMDIPTTDIGFYMDIPTLDGSELKERNSIIGSSSHRGNQTEFISSLLSGPPGEYQIGVVAYRGQVVDQPYRLEIQVEPRILSRPPDFQPARSRLFLTPGAPANPNVRALALTHSGRMDQLYSGTGSSVLNSLGNLATKAGWGPSTVEVIDLKSDPYVQDAYLKWQSAEANPEAANQVCEAIRSLITERLARYANLQYLILAGSDQVIPFYRAREQVLLGAEARYTKDQQWPFTTGNPMHEAFRLGYHLTDSFYGALRAIPWRDYAVYIPELSVGRLVETAKEIDSQVVAYLGNSPRSIINSVVTGYDFLSDQAAQLRLRLKAAGITQLATLEDNSWGVVALRNLLRSNPQLITLNGHFNHQYALTAIYDLFASEELKDGSLYNFKGALFISVGCHSGLNVPLPGSTDPKGQDFAQTIAGLGGLLIGNLGYGFGDSDEIIFSELLIKLVIEQLTAGVSSVGKALMLAKQKYLQECAAFGFTEYDIKALNVSTLYGVPMYEMQVPKPIPVSIASPATSIPAIRSLAQLPPSLKSQITEVNLPLNKWEQVDTFDGSYYRLPDEGGKMQARPGHPLLPKVIHPIKLLDSRNRPGGVLILEARYQKLTDFKPKPAGPVADLQNSLQIVERDFIAADGWLPAPLAQVNRRQVISSNGNNPTGYATGRVNPAQVEDNLVVLPMQVRNPGLAWLYSYLKLEIYESPRLNREGPQVVQVGSNQSGGRVNFQVQIRQRSASFPLPEVIRVVITYSLLGGDRWLSADLKLDPTDPDGERWIGYVDGIGGQPGSFFVQVVDGDGNVTWSDNKGLLNTWVGRSLINPPRTIRARLRGPQDCNKNDGKAHLFLQAVGSELGSGINRIYYRITYRGSQPPIEGSIRSSAGEVIFPVKNLSGIEYWAEDTLQPPQLETVGGSGRRKIHIVTNGNNAGAGSLRQALNAALEGDTIIFQLPRRTDGGNSEIRLTNSLPVVTQKGLTIDGLFPACDGKPTVEISNEGAINTALTVRAAEVTVRGLFFSGFNKYDILLDGENTSKGGSNPRNCLIEQNILSYITDHRIGIALLGDCYLNTIKGNTLMRCNDWAGLLIRGAQARNNRVIGNFIGTNQEGNDSFGQTIGVRLDKGAHHNTIGGWREGEANYICANAEYGVLIADSETTANRVSNNKIGLSPLDNKSPLGNGRAGVKIERGAYQNVVEGNYFYDNDNALHIWDGAHHNLILRNRFEDFNEHEREIWIGQTNQDDAQENALQANEYWHVKVPVQLGDTSSYRANGGMHSPKNFSASAQPNQLKITAGPASTEARALVDVYLVRLVDIEYFDYIWLGNFTANGDGSLAGSAVCLNVLPLKNGDKVALTATRENSGNSSGFSPLVKIQ